MSGGLDAFSFDTQRSARKFADLLSTYEDLLARIEDLTRQKETIERRLKEIWVEMKFSVEGSLPPETYDQKPDGV